MVSSPVCCLCMLGCMYAWVYGQSRECGQSARDHTLRKGNSPSSSSCHHSARGGTWCPLLSSTMEFHLSCPCAGLVYTVTVAVTSCVHLPCFVQKTLFPRAILWLRRSAFLFLLLQRSPRSWGNVDVPVEFKASLVFVVSPRHKTARAT